MAYYDRDYYRDPAEAAGRSANPFGQRLRMASFTTWLIIINVAVYVLDVLLVAAGLGAETQIGTLGPLQSIGYFSAETAVHSMQIWRFITFQFLHAGIGHLFFNMLALYFFGPMVEQYLGSRRFLGYYLLCGMAGAAAYLVLWRLGIIVSEAWVPLVGASAGIFGILLAGARIAPNTKVMLLFPPIPISLKAMAWIFVGIALLTILQQGPNAGGEAAHLGGAVLGFLLIRRPGLLDWCDRVRLGGVSPGKIRKQHRRQRFKNDEDSERKLEYEVDRILEKVHRDGLNALTSKEKRILQQATHRRRD